MCSMMSRERSRSSSPRGVPGCRFRPATVERVDPFPAPRCAGPRRCPRACAACCATPAASASRRCGCAVRTAPAAASRAGGSRAAQPEVAVDHVADDAQHQVGRAAGRDAAAAASPAGICGSRCAKWSRTWQSAGCTVSSTPVIDREADRAGVDGLQCRRAEASVPCPRRGTDRCCRGGGQAAKDHQVVPEVASNCEGSWLLSRSDDVNRPAARSPTGAAATAASRR